MSMNVWWLLVPLCVAVLLLIASYPEFWQHGARRRARKWDSSRELDLREMVWTCPCGYTLSVVGFSGAVLERLIAEHNDRAHGGEQL